MTLTEKLEAYLSRRKSPVTVAQMANRFMASGSSISHSMKDIQTRRTVVVTKIGLTNWYRIKHF